MEDIQQWFTDHPNSTNIIKYLIWIILVFIVIAWIRRSLKKNLPDNSVKYKTQKGIEVLGYVLVIIITITYFTGSIKDFGLAIGLLTAGITITLQETKGKVILASATFEIVKIPTVNLKEEKNGDAK